MEEKKLQGKVAVVTGAGIGIGIEISRRLANLGAKVVLNDVDEDVANRAVTKIRESGGACEALSGDAGDPECARSLVETAVERFGRIDFAVANAGITSASSILDIEPQDLQRMLSLNLQGSVFLAQAAGRRMIEQGEGGRILFMSSVTGHQAHQGLVCYGMTKAALQMLAKGLVVEFARHGITTNAISPGAVITERTLEIDPDFVEKWAKETPTGRVCHTSDIANAALFLLSEQAAQITGQTLLVDGGWTSTSPVPDLDG